MEREREREMTCQHYVVKCEPMWTNEINHVYSKPMIDGLCNGFLGHIWDDLHIIRVTA